MVDLDLFEVDPDTGAGELLIRGSNIVKGYWNKPEATAQAFVDGWLHTGDMARIDEDGFVQIVDRKKDMICRGGENVYCVEVENALAAHPAVFEVAVMGVADKVMGEKVGAVIVPSPGREADALGDHSVCAKTSRRLQGSSVRFGSVPAVAAKSGREDFETGLAEGNRVGQAGQVSLLCERKIAKTAKGGCGEKPREAGENM